MAASESTRIPVLGVVAPSGTGKTTLLTALLPRLTAAGLRVGVIKQARDDFDLDQPGKDSFRLRRAGVERLLIAAERQSALIIELPEPREPTLDELLALFDPSEIDLVLVEGLRDAECPKLILHRAGRPAPMLNDHRIVAVVSDTRLDTAVPLLDLDRPETVADLVRVWLQRQTV